LLGFIFCFSRIYKKTTEILEFSKFVLENYKISVVFYFFKIFLKARYNAKTVPNKANVAVKKGFCTLK